MTPPHWLYLVIGSAVLALVGLGGMLVGLLPGRRGRNGVRAPRVVVANGEPAAVNHHGFA